MKKIKPLSDNIVIEPVKEEEKTKTYKKPEEEEKPLSGLFGEKLKSALGEKGQKSDSQEKKKTQTKKESKKPDSKKTKKKSKK